MQSRFGIKDFILMVMVAFVGVLVLMSMFVKDRNWISLQQLDDRIKSVETSAGRISTEVDRIATYIEEGGALSSGSTTPKVDETPSWAVPGVKIDWQPAFVLDNDPTKLPDFQPGGVFIECFEAQLSKLTSYVAEDTYGRRIEDWVVERLARYNPVTLELQGVLAEAWQYDPEGMWLRVKLRDRARFSDGVPVLAEDVAFTFNDYIMNPELETESVRSVIEPYLERVDVVSERTVEFHFKKPGAYNLNAALVTNILPKHFFEKFTPQQINEQPALLMGSGPYKLVNTDWVPGDTVVIERNEQYWGPKPLLDEMRFLVIDNEEARLQAMINKEVDMILPSSPQYKDYQDNPAKAEQYNIGLHRWMNMRSGYGFIGWQCGERDGKLTPFHDKRVRQAMTMLLDRELMIRDIWVGNGFVAVGPNNGPVPTVPKDAKPWPYNPGRAKQLLAEAGWIDRDGDGILENEKGQPFRFEFTRAVGGQTAERMQDYIVTQCRDAGIVCTPNVVEWAQYDQIMKTRNFDAIVLGWSASDPESDPSQIWHTDSIKNQGHNFVQWDGGQDPLIESIRTERDYNKRMEAWHKFHNLVHEEQPYTFIRALPWSRFIDKEYTNIQEYASGLEPREFMFTGQD